MDCMGFEPGVEWWRTQTNIATPEKRSYFYKTIFTSKLNVKQFAQCVGLLNHEQ